MHESVLIAGLISTKDGWLIAIPLGLILFVQFFRLDTLVAAARRPKREVRRFCGPDAVGYLVLTDPDGRAVHSGRVANPSRLALRGAGPVVEARIEVPGERVASQEIAIPDRPYIGARPERGGVQVVDAFRQ